MARKQAADDCREIGALRRHLYDSPLFWLGVCTAGQKFRLSSPPSFFFQRWELGRGLECRETVKWLVLASPSSPFLSSPVCGGGGARGEGRDETQLELCEML